MIFNITGFVNFSVGFLYGAETHSVDPSVDPLGLASHNVPSPDNPNERLYSFLPCYSLKLTHLTNQ